MFGNGLEREVIIKILPRAEQVPPSMFSAGGIAEYDYERLIVWANKGYDARFQEIHGVLKADSDNTGHKYVIYVDPRYNLKWVMAEIEAVCKTEEPAREQKPKSGALVSNGWLTFDDEPKPPR